jgi:hypothetical protein
MSTRSPTINSHLGRVYQNYLLAAILLEKPAPTNLLMRRDPKESQQFLDSFELG